MKREGGTAVTVRIERKQCTNDGCRRIHNALPDILTPYKHYASEVISGVLDDAVTPDDLDSEEYPCETTMYRWKHWLMVNYFRIEGYLKSISHNYGDPVVDHLQSTDSLLEAIRTQTSFWLERILRAIYNSGGFLVPSR